MKAHDRLDPECVDVTEIATVLELPADHPRRRHAESCTRCRSLMASYVSFVEAGPVEGADLERVRGMLDARIRADASRWRPSRAPARAFWWQALLRPAPLLAAGLVVIAAAVFWTTRGPEQSSLRESNSQPQAFALSLAEVATDGSIQLHWGAMTGADGYQVRLYGPDFGEIYRSPNTAVTSLTVERTALPPNLPPTLDLTWRVFALSQGDVIATSAPGSIRTR
jgi:hypothetical protein